MSTIFLRDESFYQRNINPIGDYLNQSAFYLNRMTGKDFDYCRNYTLQTIREKKFPDIKDPQVVFFERGENGDKEEMTMSLSNYISTIVKEDLILVPTFTCYVKPNVVKSLLAEFTVRNTKVRSIAKKAAAVAKANGDMDTYIIKNNEQDNRKRYNNSLSGTFVAEGTVVNNPTAHSTLTSITRTVGSLGNASNEKIISGNRHYRNADIALYNIIAIASQMNREEFQLAMDKFGLVYPTIEQTIECILYSLRLYGYDQHAFKKVVKFLETLDHLELAAIVYTGDFYHLRKYNEGFVRDFLTRLAKKVKGISIPDAMTVCRKTDEMVMNYAHQICMTEVRGIGKDYEKLSEENLNTLAATALNVEMVVKDYRDLINAVFLSKTMPSSTAYIPGMMRRTVVLSDTDSTMFAIDEWVLWYFNELRFDDEGFALSGAVMYLATQAIAHTLAIFSANMGVARENLFMLAMKPEYVFPVFAQTTVAKHYYTITYVKEGSVYKKPEMEIKGVHLKNSAAPKAITKMAADKMQDILLDIMNGKQIEMNKHLQDVVDLERSIINSLASGEVKYLKKSKIKNKEAYSDDEFKSPYQHHQLWLDVFVPKYKTFENPTYTVLKIPTTLKNKTKVNKWLAGLKDRDLAARMATWLQKYNKKAFGTFHVSEQYAMSYGIPEEILEVINVKKVVLDLTNAHRMILGTLGYFPKKNWLLSEQLEFE